MYVVEQKIFFNSVGQVIPGTTVREAIKISEELDFRIVQYWSPDDINIQQFKSEQLQGIFHDYHYTEKQISECVSYLRHYNKMGHIALLVFTTDLNTDTLFAEILAVKKLPKF